MTNRSFNGKFDIATNRNYGNRIFNLTNNEPGFAPPPPPQNCYFLLQEDGSYILLEDGVSRLEQECSPAPILCSFLLQEDGYFLLQEDGSKLELECEAIPPMVTFSLTFAGPWAGNQTISISYQQLASTVTIYMPALSVAATTSALMVSTAGLPTLIRPTTDYYQSGIPVINNSVNVDGSIKIEASTGIVTIGLNLVIAGEVKEFNQFQSTGNAGFNSFRIPFLK